MYCLGTTSLRAGARLCLNRPANYWETDFRSYRRKVPVATLKASCSKHEIPVLNSACSQLCKELSGCLSRRSASLRMKDWNNNLNKKKHIWRAAAAALGLLGKFYWREFTQRRMKMQIRPEIVKPFKNISGVSRELSPLSDHLPVFPFH